ncbi:aldose epimerase family protein [Commensalibacter oyaizuii]|uniref:Aldose 1-epimerase n=1 Tax=Commensalibacter oyaizuii TaxID=3043873 RepID=A0ABT6Q082_9PROT|nr:aldose epimerase family protein [Commensalibacter sp. TBRC 16381]MDI2090146.1 aldose epimerase family protein [Commensalibacter sp. TBRC 16381]
MANDSNNIAKISLREQPYGQTVDGEYVKEFILKNNNGIEVRFITYGGTITSIMAPDKNGNCENIVLGFASLQEYENNPGARPYFGALIGRYANRIAGKFTIADKEYSLSLNEPPNCLHGGMNGFDRKVWKAEVVRNTDQIAEVRLTLESPDGDQGFPGNLLARVTYSLNNNNEFSIHYQATTDKTTVVNLTNHSYFNLSGEGKGTVESHLLKLFCSAYTPVDQYMIPTGEVASVIGTPMDFNKPTLIGVHLRDSFEQLHKAKGFDHNWVVDGKPGKSVRPAAELYDPISGRKVDVFTTTPGMQVYTGNGLDGSLIGSSGKVYRQGDGIAFEPQYFPDSPNQNNFPSTVLNPNELYDEKTVYYFSVIS